MALFKGFEAKNRQLFPIFDIMIALITGQLEKVELENGNRKNLMEMAEMEMEKDVENGKGRQSDSIFNAKKLAK